MKKLYKFYRYSWRGGDVEGLLIADDQDVESLIGEEIYFGEICGKHSEVVFEIEKEHFTVVSEDQDFIGKLEELLGATVSGINPFDFLEPEEDLDDDLGEGDDEEEFWTAEE